MRTAVVLCACLIFGGAVRAQQPAVAGPEHKMLQGHEGTWDTTMKMDGMEFKGVVKYKMELGGLWLIGSMESDLGGQKFFGKSLDTYDAAKKKYIGIWCDSMSTTPLMMEGTYDAVKKTMTMEGEGPGMDGKPTKWRSVAVGTDKDTVEMSMYVGDAKQPMFTITYKRK